MKKKIIAVLLSACMLVSACPTGAFAMSDEETNTYTATGDVMQGGAPVVDERPRPRRPQLRRRHPLPLRRRHLLPPRQRPRLPLKWKHRRPPPQVQRKLHLRNRARKRALQ